MKIIGLYSGKTKNIGPKREHTGIFKQPIEQATINQLGIVGDIQVDKRYHGGPQRALHQFALSSYEKIIKRYPLLHKKAQPGSFGENISSPHMHDDNVCIGDIYKLGNVRLQVSSPRLPCWKIDEKFKQPGLSTFVLQQRIAGWYYRVLEGGLIQLDDEFELIERPNPDISINSFVAIHAAKQADESVVLKASQAEGLDPGWKQRLEQKTTKAKN